MLQNNDSDSFLSSQYKFGNAEIDLHSKPGLTVFVARGPYSATLFKEMSRLLSRSKGTVGLDLKGLKNINISTIGLLETIRRKLKSQGGELVLMNPDGRVMDLLKLSGKEHDFKVTDADFDLPRIQARTSRKVKKDPRASTGRIAKNGAPERSIVHFRQDITKVASFEKTMDTAERRQKMLLPTETPVADGFDFAASYEPCEKVGGDFYDFIPLGPNHLGIAIADVSGHGLVAALYMGMLKIVLRIRAQKYVCPSDVLKLLNADLVPWIDRNSFISAAYGIVDFQKRTFVIARAGHNLPILYNRKAGDGPREIDSPGFVIGMDKGTAFNSAMGEATINLSHGDLLFQYTDGLVEARNSYDEEFGTERLYEVMRSSDVNTGQELLQVIKKSVLDFIGDRELEDDITMLSLKVH